MVQSTHHASSSAGSSGAGQCGLVSAALVREWLKRHGLTSTLATMDKEMPRGEDDISSRTELGRVLGIEKQLRRNREKEKAADPAAFLSTLEVLSDFVIRSAHARSKAPSGAGEKAAPDGHGDDAKHTASKSSEPSPVPLQPLNNNSSTGGGNSSNNSSTSPKQGVGAVAGTSTSLEQGGPSSSSPPSSSRSGLPMGMEVRMRPAAVERTGVVDDMASMEIEDMEENEWDEVDDGRIAPSASHGGAHKAWGAGSWIGVEQAVALRALVFGSGASSRSGFSDAWMQGIFASPHKGLEWAIVQTAGGPCGVLACVQAYMLRHLLFVENRIEVAGISQGAMRQATIEAITDILWQAGGETRAKLCVKGHHTLTGDEQDRMRSNKYKPDGVTEQINVLTGESRSDLLDMVAQHSALFTDEKGAGVPLLLYSAVLSRGIENVKADIGTMDGQARLMGAHDYCTQEMVNLLLVGRAVPNTFDGNKDLDGLVLNGIHKRSHVGLLTLFEHYGSMQVGDMLKVPRSPVWVVCSESHFSVCFATDSDAVSRATDEGGRFDLQYYDQLAKQDEGIRLSVCYDTVRAMDPKVILDHDKDMTPPLEHCIRTKWAHAEVDWNGTDPIL